MKIPNHSIVVLEQNLRQARQVKWYVFGSYIQYIIINSNMSTLRL
jgi:hypothetical protein